jgi:transcriptional regulator with XRE-family HTH domain
VEEVEKIGGSVREGDKSAGEIFGERLAAVRKARGWTQAELARRVAERGGVGVGRPLHRVKLGKLETDPEKAKHVTLEEVLAISYALDVSPLYMLAPLDDLRGARLIVAGGVQPTDPHDARMWLKGEEPLLGQDDFTFTMQRPASEIPEQLAARPNVMRRLQEATPYTEGTDNA